MILDRIEENKLDALYLFINEPLRDRATFDRFLDNILTLIPQNWSIQRVEVGHEFLSMVPEGRQGELFENLNTLESLRTLIISDGYVPRKDMGSIETKALLSTLPKAQNLLNLDLQRLCLEDDEEVDLLAEILESMQSLEEVRITGLFLKDKAPSLDRVITACKEMANLRALAISGAKVGPHLNDSRPFISKSCLQQLCQNSSTLQDLSLRAMHLDDGHCRTMADALITNSFLTTLDLRQNSSVGEEGYMAILQALERNHDLWCTVMVDNEAFQGKFNSLIKLNQADRGDLVRNPSREKLITFITKLNDDPTAIWYFLTIHDSILYPLVDYLKWKLKTENARKLLTKKHFGADDNVQDEPNKRARI